MAYKFSAIAAAVLVAYNVGHDKGSEPKIIEHCIDAPVPEGGSFADALQEAAQEANANTGPDYYEMASNLEEKNVTETNPKGRAHPNQPVWIGLDDKRNLKSYGLGPCEMPWQLQTPADAPATPPQN